MTCPGEQAAYEAGREAPTCKRCHDEPCMKRSWSYGGGYYDICEPCMNWAAFEAVESPGIPIHD